MEDGKARLVSRHGNRFKSFPRLTTAIGSALEVQDAVLDGEIVHLGPDGVPQFYDLMRRRSPQHFFAFDLLWLNGCDLRRLPLLERKALLREIVAPQPAYPLSFLYALGLNSRYQPGAAVEAGVSGISAAGLNTRWLPRIPTISSSNISLWTATTARRRRTLRRWETWRFEVGRDLSTCPRPARSAPLGWVHWNRFR